MGVGVKEQKLPSAYASYLGIRWARVEITADFKGLPNGSVLALHRGYKADQGLTYSIRFVAV